MSVQPQRQPRRSGRQRRADLSQHFLTPGAAFQFVEQARVAGSDLVVEIGAGTGMLTRALAARAQRVVAIEIDGTLAAKLRRSLASDASVEVIAADALAAEWPASQHRVVANLPFSRTADLVRRVAADPSATEAHLIVQLEAAERFAGSPYARESLESLRMKPWWHTEIIGEVPAAAFSPRPSVSAAVLWMLRRERPLLAADDGTRYLEFVERAFGQGQTVRQCLRRVLSAAQLRRAGARLRLNLEGLPGELTFDQWLALYRFAVARDGAALTRLRWSRRRRRGGAARSRRPGPRSPRAGR